MLCSLLQEALLTKESSEHAVRAMLCKPLKKIQTPPDPIHDAITHVLPMQDSVNPIVHTMSPIALVAALQDVPQNNCTRAA
jgi:hypothetical protein